MAVRGKSKPPSEPPTMTVMEVCELLRICKGTLYRMIKQRRIPYFRVGSDLRFNRDEMNRWRKLGEERTDRVESGRRGKRPAESKPDGRLK